MAVNKSIEKVKGTYSLSGIYGTFEGFDGIGYDRLSSIAKIIQEEREGEFYVLRSGHIATLSYSFCKPGDYMAATLALKEGKTEKYDAVLHHFERGVYKATEILPQSLHFDNPQEFTPFPVEDLPLENPARLYIKRESIDSLAEGLPLVGKTKNFRLKEPLRGELNNSQQPEIYRLLGSYL
ncbi:MAG: hypothetical protein ACOCZ6_04210 [Nanoarchaeota archaeon]